MIRISHLKLSLLAWMLLGVLSVHAQDEDRMFIVYDASNGMADNGAQTVKCTKTGRMVISTIGHINFYDGSSFVHIDPKEENVYQLSKYRGHYRQMFDKHHHLWLKDKNQVTCVDLMMEKFVPRVKDIFLELGFKKPVNDLFTDVNNHLWALSGETLYGLDDHKEFKVRKDAELQDINVFDSRVMLLFYGDGSVSAYDLNTGSFLFERKADTEEEAQRYARSSFVTPYRQGYFQIRNASANEAILRYFDMQTRKWKTVMEEKYHLNSIEFRDEKLYMGCAEGYWIYNLKTAEKKHIIQLALSKSRFLTTDVNALVFDRQGGMWIGTEKRGLLYSKPYPTPFYLYGWNDPESMRYYLLMEKKLPASAWKSYNRPINNIYQDSRGWTWTAMYTGLKLEKTKGGKKRIFTKKDGLMNEMVHSIVEDARNDIWVATSYGISHLFIKNNDVTRVETYISKDNVPRESFVNGMAALLSDGRIVMQSQDYMVVFDPNEFHNKQEELFPLYPKMTKILVNGQEVEANKEVDGHVIVNRAISRAKEINVNYDQNSLSLHFTALNYFRPNQTYYRVRIKGIPFYDDWRVLSHANSAGLVDKNGILHLPLTGVRPGRYDIELQASLTPDGWSHEPYVWTLLVNEPWWRTTGLYMLLLVFMLTVLLANFYYYNRNTRLRMMCKNEGTDIIHRIRLFADRCTESSNEILSPYTVSLIEQDERYEKQSIMSEEFMEVMQKIVPYVNSLDEDAEFTVSQLAAYCGVPTKKLYQLLAEHLDKNPRPLIGRLRLQIAEDMLINTDMEIEAIAAKCHFASPNFFLASFYHQYRMTPIDYRNTKAR